MFSGTSSYTTASNTPPSTLTRQRLKKFISIIGVDFVKAEAIVAVTVDIRQANKILHLYNNVFHNSTLQFEWLRMSFCMKPKPTPNVRRSKPNDMTRAEIKIQKALGTLPFREWMKIKGILFENSWWYFPIGDNVKCNPSKTVTINNREHYPVADGYIEDLQHSMSWNNWSEEKFADEIIIQCYQCMGMENIDL
ncbi:hypothetical protein LCGC14_1942170 [marine sediment metagenome]|uniref:Uncharacterized protein n=1 Tax=marine sediment metagenome TaxID=412755 RepID=A0A0F9FK82_9ZZZZ